MKKISYIFLTILLFIPVMVNAAECDTSKVYIESIGIDSQSGSALETEEATAKDKTINMNLEMFELEDSVKYKIIIKNDSNEDYELDQKSIKTNSQYMDYLIESEDKSNIIKSKTSKTVYLTVQYSNPVPDNAYNNGSFSDEVTMKVNLSSEDSVPNPATGIKYYFIVALIVIVCGLLSLMFRKNKSAVTTIVIIGILLIPLSVSALCKCQIELRSIVSIKKPIYNGTITRSSSTNLKIGDTIDFSNIKCITRSNCSYIDENEYNTKDFYIKHEIENNVVKSSYVCRGNICLKGATTTDFEANKQLFFTYHSESQCTITDERVFNSGSNDYIEANGNVRLGNYCGNCKVNADGTSLCYNLDMKTC